MAVNENIIRTEQLEAGYGHKAVVSGAEISVRRGEILVLIGPNGAGKSTVLKTIAGTLAPVAGTVYIDGKDRGTLSAQDVAKKQAVMLTGRRPAERMSCEDVISLGRYPYTGRLGILSEKDREKVRKAMELVHVTELAGRDYEEISDGQRQRVLLARAICQEPDVMILDEPTSYLDIRHKLEFIDTLKMLVKSRGIGVIMSMHELELAHLTADRVLCIASDGKIFAEGTPDEMFREDIISGLYGVEDGSISRIYREFTDALAGAR